MTGLELWGGHECTVNRIGDDYLDQTIRSGHQDRFSDLELFAGLGLKALRYPVLWERVEKVRGERDWRWTDERLDEIERLGMRPIAGLVHHGSGPPWTNLCDDGFAPGLAAFARAAAERYPWVTDWTPVNEPLTTARFSALYGHWYPHLKDERRFWHALLNQIDGVRLAMAEIRAVNPGARLIQTEDLGQTYSTPQVAEQAAFDNLRRWLTWDLLTGKVDKDHPLWPRFARFRLTDRLKRIADAPCPPDVIGINHYLTSDRFLDHRLERYPPERHGGNGVMAFADVEAVRVLQPAPLGLEHLMDQAWERYGLPLAVTEAHNGCTREEQLRWVQDAWDTARRLRGRGVPVQAVTAWALLGSYDWNSLLTRDAGHYECGVFDLRGGRPRPTAMVPLLRALAREAEPECPLSSQPGWWRRDVRLEFQPTLRIAEIARPHRSFEVARRPCRPVLITGATGTLGQALARACEWRGVPYVLTDRRALDLSDPASITAALEAFAPWAVINAAGWVRVDEAEAEPDACLAANAAGAVALAAACAEGDLPYVTFSSDLVFDGRAGRAYVESDTPAPLNAYGRSKAQAEQAVLALSSRALVIRTAAFFSPHDSYNFPAWVRRELRAGRRVHAASDAVVSPTYVPDLVDATLDLLVDRETGIWHLASPGALSWADLAVTTADAFGLDSRLVVPTPRAEMGWAAERPAYAPLSSERGLLLAPFEHAMARYVAALAPADIPGEAEAELDRGERRPQPIRRRAAATARTARSKVSSGD